MSPRTPSRLRLATLATALAACYPLAAHSAAGTVQFAIGDVSIRRGSSTIAAAKGTEVQSGDALATGPTGRAQIKFSDGGFIALQPNTKFDVANYADTGDTKQDKFLVKLTEGGLRAITGAIGHRDRNNYKVETPTALIGIRGLRSPPSMTRATARCGWPTSRMRSRCAPRAAAWG